VYETDDKTVRVTKGRQAGCVSGMNMCFAVVGGFVLTGTHGMHRMGKDTPDIPSRDAGSRELARAYVYTNGVFSDALAKGFLDDINISCSNLPAAITSRIDLERWVRRSKLPAIQGMPPSSSSSEPHAQVSNLLLKCTGQLCLALYLRDEDGAGDLRDARCAWPVLDC